MNIAKERLRNASIPSLTACLPTDTEADRKVAWEQQRSALIRLLEKHEYGSMPRRPEHLKVATESVSMDFGGGSATRYELCFTVEIGGESASFPAYAIIPNRQAPCPAIVCIGTHASPYQDRLPIEEIIDRGYAVIGFCHADVATEDRYFNTGLSRLLVKNRRNKTSLGKIGLWAYAAMRIMDYLQTLPYVQKDQIAIIGHGCRGAAALWAGALDERYRFVIANDSGLGGASLLSAYNRDTLQRRITESSYLFCPTFAEASMAHTPFLIDQHMLLSLIAPRFLLLGTAVDEPGNDPEGMLACAMLASRIYRDVYELPGLVHSSKKHAEGPLCLSRGTIHYHSRKGTGGLCRRDFLLYLDFMDHKHTIAKIE